MRKIRNLLKKKGLACENKQSGRDYERKLVRAVEIVRKKERYGETLYRIEIRNVLAAIFGWFKIENIELHFPDRSASEQEIIERIAEMVVFTDPVKSDEKCWYEIDPMVFRENEDWLSSKEVNALFSKEDQFKIRFLSQEEREHKLVRATTNIVSSVVEPIGIHQLVHDRLVPMFEEYLVQNGDKILAKEQKIKQKAKERREKKNKSND